MFHKELQLVRNDKLPHVDDVILQPQLSNDSVQILSKTRANDVRDKMTVDDFSLRTLVQTGAIVHLKDQVVKSVNMQAVDHAESQMSNLVNQITNE